MTDPRPAPYPADTRAKGWRFELDYEQIEQSGTWASAMSAALDGLPLGRPLLLAMWYAAWKQVPCGSLPSDERELAGAIGIPRSVFDDYREVLMRGWWVADDGRLYHDTLVKRVMEMTATRSKDRARKTPATPKIPAKQKGDPKEPEGAPEDSGGIQPESSTYHLPPVGEATPSGVARARPEPAAPLTLVKPAKPAIPDCPHLQVLALWAEVLPDMPQHDPDQWGGARADHLRARWRTTAAKKGWATADDGLAYLRRLFEWVGRSPFLTGRAGSTRDGRRPFQVELEWLVKPLNWAKVIEGKYHEGDAA